MVSRNLRFKFTLVSYNILSQTILNDHGYLYTSCNPRDLEWPRRGHRIVSELLKNQADIICLQEVESEHLQSLYRPKLASGGYDCVYKKKTGYQIDGCAIFYKSKLFHLLNYKGIEFNRTDVTNILNRDNVGIIAVLKPRIFTQSRSSHLVIANTHLLFNPARSDIRLAQLKCFLSELEELSLKSYDNINNERCHHPTILCGDLNSPPDSDISRFILKNTTSTPNNNDSQPSRGINEAQAEASRSETRTNDEEAERTTRTTSTNHVDVTSQDDQDDDDDKSRIRSEQSINNDMATSDQDDKEVRVRQPNCVIDCEQSLRHYSHSLQFESAYPSESRSGQKYVSTFSSCIVDYIFYTPKNLHLDSYKELFTQQQLEDIGPLPTDEFPSDHFSLEAKFVLK